MTTQNTFSRSFSISFISPQSNGLVYRKPEIFYVKRAWSKESGFSSLQF